MSSFQLPAAPERLLAWLAQLGRSGSFGVLRTPEGEEFVVARPEHLAELDSILSDPGFVEALEQGVSDVVAARVRTMEGSLGGKGGTLASRPEVAEAVERGVEDLREQRLSTLRERGRLSDLL